MRHAHRGWRPRGGPAGVAPVAERIPRHSHAEWRAACRADMPPSSPSKTRDYIPAQCSFPTPSSIEVDFESKNTIVKSQSIHRSQDALKVPPDKLSETDRAELLSRIIISDGVALSSLAELLVSHPARVVAGEPGTKPTCSESAQVAKER